MLEINVSENFKLQIFLGGGGGLGGGETCPWTPDKGNMDKHLLCNKPPFQQPTQFILYIYFIF